MHAQTARLPETFNAVRILQALEDATIFRRARSMTWCENCAAAEDGRCDDHAVDLHLISGYEDDFREISATLAPNPAWQPDPAT